MRTQVLWFCRLVIAVAGTCVLLGATAIGAKNGEPVAMTVPYGVDLCGPTPAERLALSSFLSMRSRHEESLISRAGISLAHRHEIVVCEEQGETTLSVHYRNLADALPTSGIARFGWDQRRLVPLNAGAKTLLY